MTHLAFCRVQPRSQVLNCHGQGFEGLAALTAEEVELLVLAGSPKLISHTNSTGGLQGAAEQTDPSGDPSHDPTLADSSVDDSNRR
jgi:hypothetical protein